MSRWRLLLVVPLLAVALATHARAELDPQQVRTCIERAINYLRGTQEASGLWPATGIARDGASSLCVLALLNAGVPATDPQIVRALRQLERIERPESVYLTSLQTMIFCLIDPQRYQGEIHRNTQWLESAQISSGPAKGSWSYQHAAEGNDQAGDNSNSQFALLALHEAQRAGIPVSPKTWDFARRYWIQYQNQNADDFGSWSYKPAQMRNQSGTGSMTCAGIAALIITADETGVGDARVKDGQVECCQPHEDSERIAHGVKWLEKHFSVQHNPDLLGVHNVLHGKNWLYYMYALERVGRMTNQRFIGAHDWYREGVEVLLAQQDPLDGGWTGNGLGESVDRNIATSLALLFLAKGRRPVLAAKAIHAPGDDWGNHRSDLANLTSFVEQVWHQDLTWQLVDVSKAKQVDDLLQSKVLYLSGKKAPEFTDHECALLRQYVDRGGFIFADACCEGGEFVAGFEVLLRRMYPREPYRLEILPPSHLIWSADRPVDPQRVRPLKGVDIGCRTAIVLSTNNLSCYWELARPGRYKELPPEIRKDVDACLAIGTNVLAYATNRDVKFKYELFQNTATKTGDPTERGKILLARLAHGGGCATAPAAAANLMRLAGEKLDLRVRTEVPEISLTDPVLFRHHMVMMHGRFGFILSDAEREALRLYLERGGLLLADAICSSADFDASFRREMKIIASKTPLERIPPGDPIYSDKFGGENIARVGIRHPNRGGKGPIGNNVREDEPQLEGIKINGRYNVIYSRYDLSCALENHESLECEGYIREDAARLGLNVLSYSLNYWRD
jgi:hypothetical protein